MQSDCRSPLHPSPELACTIDRIYRTIERQTAALVRQLTVTLALLFGVTTSTVAYAETVIRVNVGGQAYTDSASNLWSADTGSNGTGFTSQTSAAIAGTSDPTLFRTYRYDPPGGAEMQYSFAVPAGQYQVKLYFAENYAPLFDTGVRVFDVLLEGTKVFSNLDIYKEVGGHAALIKVATVTVSDGTLNLELEHVVENPLLNAIEITGLSSSSSPPSTTANTAPTLTGTPATSIAAGQAYRFQPTASDANGDPLTFSIQNKPSWATLSTTTGLLSGTAVAGSYPNIVMSVTDGKASVSLAPYSLTVTSPPTTSSVVLAWAAPAANTDGSALTNLRGYRITYGTSPNALNTQVQVNDPSITSGVIHGLVPNTYYFAIKSYNNAGVESALSPILSKVIR